MTERVALDTNAAIEWLRTGNKEPRGLRTAGSIVVPLPAMGELYTGVYASANSAANLDVLEEFLAAAEIISPDEHTARSYGRIRARLHLTGIRAAKMNDLWIAALCIQHALPLLTNDRGFDSIEGLTVIHW